MSKMSIAENDAIFLLPCEVYFLLTINRVNELTSFYTGHFSTVLSFCPKKSWHYSVFNTLQHATFMSKLGRNVWVAE